MSEAKTIRLVDIESVALYLGVRVRHIRRLVAERRIPFVKWGRLLRFDLEEIDRWIANHGVEPL
ncbi:MAG: helix-turn-helix domain-containing protein [Actinobacteria bacterium]|nr:helix-turn-helix domain-containing protein [Actinomycetota bacterium]